MPFRNAEKKDAVFQLSLTELAFILVFLMLLLAGVKSLLDQGELVAEKEKSRRNLAEKNLCEKSISKQNACESIQKNLGEGRTTAELAIAAQQIIDSQKKEIEQLRALVTDGDARLTAFVSIEELLKQKDGAEKLKGLLTSSVVAASQLQAITGKKLEPGKEGELIKAVSDALASSRTCESAKSEASQCKSELGFYVSKYKKDGFGLPPCWIDADSKVEYLFVAELGSRGISLRPAWPNLRREEAEKFQDMNSLLSDKPHSLEAFMQLTQGIFRSSKQSMPECRHYVRLRRSTDLQDISRFNQMRLGVENHFYKLDETQNK